MKSGTNRRIVRGLALAALSAMLVTGLSSWATGGTILTTTGRIVRMEGMVVTLSAIGTFYPVKENQIPDWAMPGARASMSYYIKNGRNYYYEIVKPGEKFAVKEALERDQKTRY
jgi:hypothetical protein